MSGTHAHAESFVAERFIEPAPPPPGETGWLAWLKANLFGSPRDVVLTVLAVGLVVWLLPPFIDWAVLDAVWGGATIDGQFELSRDACRQISPDGACWALINARFNQFVFGFYPVELYWRPILAFLLLAVAVAPVLATALPRRMLWFSAIYPGVAYFLLWGGTIWGVAAALAGPAIGWFAASALAARIGQRDHFVMTALGAALITVLWWLFAVIPLDVFLTDAIGFVGLAPVQSNDFGGFLLTLIIGLVGISASLPLGVLLALGRQSSLPFIKGVSVVFIEFIRGVPLITLLFVASTLLNYFLPPGTTFDLILRVLIMVTFFASAYIAEAVRGGLAALPDGQYEAADALGLDYWKSMRLIILPQALKISIPSIVNIFIGLFKDTTLVSVIGLLDPLGIISPIRADSAWNGLVWEPYLFVALFFFIFCFCMSRYSMYLEGKLATDRH